MSSIFITGDQVFLVRIWLFLWSKVVMMYQFLTISLEGEANRLSAISKKIKFFNGDVKDYKDLLSKSSGHDFFIHMAAINGTEFFTQNRKRF